MLRRQRARRRGRSAEWLCLWYLRVHGWRILARGWRCPSGEIDILARRGRVLAVIEVKSRREIGAAAHRPRRGGLPIVAAPSRRTRPSIRSDAGGAVPVAPALARRLAQRYLKLQPHYEGFAPGPALPLDAIGICRTIAFGEKHRGF
jgi:putative endonuclease